MKVICDISEPTPIAFQDVYEEGDKWIKIQGCEACPLESRRQCCGNCPMFSEEKQGCSWQFQKNSAKPFNCVIKPFPNAAMSFCALQFKCVRGSNIGKIRRVCDPGGVFIDG